MKYGVNKETRREKVNIALHASPHHRFTAFRWFAFPANGLAVHSSHL